MTWSWSHSLRKYFNLLAYSLSVSSKSCGAGLGMLEPEETAVFWRRVGASADDWALTLYNIRWVD